MVKFSQAASVLLLALGTTAFVPSKLGSAGVRSSVNSGAVQKIESCDAKVGKYKLEFNFSPWSILARRFPWIDLFIAKNKSTCYFDVLFMYFLFLTSHVPPHTPPNQTKLTNNSPL